MMEHRIDFCDGCGTGQRDEFLFYEELDCGDGNIVAPPRHLALLLLMSAVANMYLSV